LRGRYAGPLGRSDEPAEHQLRVGLERHRGGGEAGRQIAAVSASTDENRRKEAYECHSRCGMTDTHHAIEAHPTCVVPSVGTWR
jgi:hypothetical protein